VSERDGQMSDVLARIRVLGRARRDVAYARGWSWAHWPEASPRGAGEPQGRSPPDSQVIPRPRPLPAAVRPQATSRLTPPGGFPMIRAREGGGLSGSGSGAFEESACHDAPQPHQKITGTSRWKGGEPRELREARVRRAQDECGARRLPEWPRDVRRDAPPGCRSGGDEAPRGPGESIPARGGAQ
jgi:hypothetical protein